MTSLLRMEGIDFAYGDTSGGWSLKIASLAVAPGEVLGFIGPNGSGKSTLLRLGAGIIEPSAGRIWLGDVPLHEMDRPAVARRLGYLPQSVRPQFDLTALEVVSLGRRPHLQGLGFLRTQDRAAVENAMQMTETRHLSDRLLSELSEGERQRVLLASILAQEPRILLLDEPTSALDIHHQVLFFQRLRALADAGMAVLVVTHDLNLASLFCDRLVLLDGGKVRSQGPPERVIRETVLTATYGPGLRVIDHPEFDRPVVLPCPAQTGAGPRPPSPHA